MLSALKRRSSKPVVVAAICCAAHGSCRATTGSAQRNSEFTTIRIGIGQLPSGQANGVRQIVQLLSVESLANFTEDGRPRPWLARDWNVSPDGLVLTVNLVPDVRFHDGTPVTSQIVADALKKTLRSTLGPAVEDLDSVSATTDHQFTVRFRRRSPFL